MHPFPKKAKAAAFSRGLCKHDEEMKMKKKEVVYLIHSINSNCEEKKCINIKFLLNADEILSTALCIPVE